MNERYDKIQRLPYLFIYLSVNKIPRLYLHKLQSI